MKIKRDRETIRYSLIPLLIGSSIECMSGGVWHCLDAIAHVISHH